MNRPTRRLFGVCVILAAAGAAAGELATVRIGTPPKAPPTAGRVRAKAPVVYVAEAKARPNLDGKLDEEAWKQASRLTLQRTLDGGGAASQPTIVMLLRDAATLYLGIRAAEPEMGKIRPGKTGRDVTVWTDDSVEVFIGLPGKSYYRFGVNAAGGSADGQGKDDSWNAPYRVATFRGADHWSVELSIPLDRLTAERPLPSEWIANFNRTRYVLGGGEEFAWSPTYSGDSHVPARFGKLILGRPPTEQAEPASGRVESRQPVQVRAVSDGVAVVRFSLSALPKAAKVHRAELRLYRGAATGAAGEDRLARLEIYARTGAAAQAKALVLTGPRQDRLDATAAVRQWINDGAAAGEFFIKTAPPLRLDASCLLVTYEGQAKNPPKQVAGVKAFHRAGQTFITFADREDSFGDEPATWGQLRDYRRQVDPQRRIRYRVYRHDKPIDADSIKHAKLLSEVEPLSAFNINGWSFERLVNQVVFSNDDRGELMKYGPFSGWTRNSPEGGRLLIPRLAIEHGKPLAPGTGLYVHSAEKKAAAYYAVTVMADGVENLSDFTSANSLAKPLAEAPATWEPVEQPEGKPFGFDFRGKRHYYVRWVAPPLAPKPMYYNWSVLVPPDCTKPAPVELYFHSAGASYARPPVKFLARSIQICPHDYPFSGWYGYNDAIDTLRSPADGLVRPYTIRRIASFLEWAAGKFPIDQKRVIAVGGDGAALMTLYRPELFAYVISPGFQGLQLDAKAAGRFVEAWGPASDRIKSEAGLSEWRWGEPDVILTGKRLPNIRDNKAPRPDVPADSPGFTRELPLFICGGRSWGVDPGYARGRGRLYYALQGTLHPLYGKWGWRRAVYPSKHTGLWYGLDITSETPVPAITGSSIDVDSEAAGNANGEYAWRDVKETPEAFEIVITGPASTFDLTPRRLSKFRIKPGEQLEWETSPVEVKTWSRDKKPEPVSGTVKADEHGLVTLKGLKLVRGWMLRIRIEKPEE